MYCAGPSNGTHTPGTGLQLSKEEEALFDEDDDDEDDDDLDDDELEQLEAKLEGTTV